MKQHWRSNSSFINFCSPHSPTFMGPLICFIALCFASLAIVAKLSFSPYMYLPLRRFRQLLWAPFTALCFPSLTIVAKLSFSPYLPNLPLSSTFMGPFTALCFASLATVANCHFRHICQIRRFRQLLWAPFTAFCFSSLAIVAKLSFSPCLPNSPLSPTCMSPLHCFVLCLVGDCGKIVIFAIFAKFAIIFSFLPFLLLCAFLDISLWGLLNRRQHASKTTVKLGGQRWWKNKRKKTWMTALQRLPGKQQGGRLRFSTSGRYQLEGTTKKGVMKCIC